MRSQMTKLNYDIVALQLMQQFCLVTLITHTETDLSGFRAYGFTMPLETTKTLLNLTIYDYNKGVRNKTFNEFYLFQRKGSSLSASHLFHWHAFPVYTFDNNILEFTERIRPQKHGIVQLDVSP